MLVRLFALGSGLALVLGLLWVLGGVRAAVAAAPPAGLTSTEDEFAAAPAAELHVCITCPYTTIQAAVDAAASGDVIKVATGVYTGVQARAGITQVVYISKTLSVQGGYTTTNWTTPDPIAYPTTLDAEELGRVLYVNGAGISVTLEGLRTTGGDATGLGGGFGGYDAGGLYVGRSLTVTLRHNVIFDNLASPDAEAYGGGACVVQANATVMDNTFLANTASTGGGASGGGLALLMGAATLSGNTFQGNVAVEGYYGTGSGGGAYLHFGVYTATGNTFLDNTASAPGVADNPQVVPITLIVAEDVSEIYLPLAKR